MRSVRVHAHWLARWGLGSWDCIFGRVRGHRAKSGTGDDAFGFWDECVWGFSTYFAKG